MRHRYRQIAQRAQIGFLSIHLYSDISIAFQRNQNRDLSKRVSNISIENIYSKYQFSNDDLIINTTDRGITIEYLYKILQRIEQAYHQPEQCRIEPEINQQNFMYQIDQKLRKLISKYLKEEFENNEKFKIINEKKIYAEMINGKRQTFLELIRQKFIILNENEDIEQTFQQYLQDNN